MSDWAIPESITEMFKNGECQYHIKDYDYSGDNIYAMNLFIEAIEGASACVTVDDGTYVELKHPDFDYTLYVHSGGLGDFHLHGYDVGILEEESPHLILTDRYGERK